MKNLMKTNCYDIENEIAIIGSCLPNMQPKAFAEIIWNRNSSNLLRLMTDSFSNNQPIDIGSQGQADGCPTGLRYAINQCNARQAH